MAGWTTAQQNLTGDGEPVRVGVGLVTANTFEVLGATPLLGPGDHGGRRTGPMPRRSPCWATGCGRRATAATRRSSAGAILLNDVPVEVVGVMPQGFRLPTDFTEEAAEPTELWRALQLDEANAERGSHGYYAAAMLARARRWRAPPRSCSRSPPR